MTHIAVHELKRGKEVWTRLERDRELVVTCDGKPRALLIHICPDTAEESLSEVRRALFSSAVHRVRRRAVVEPPSPGLVDKVIREVRRARHP